MDPNEAPEQTTPDTPTIPADTQAQVDWQQRYENLQPEYTRKSQAAADFDRLRNGEDPEALKGILEKYGYELANDEEPYVEPEPENAGIDPALLEQIQQIPDLAQFKQQMEGLLNEQSFQSDLKAIADGREIPTQGMDWIRQQTAANGDNREALEAATKSWIEFEDSLTQKKRPRAPHVPAGGQPATGGKDPADMTRAERTAWQMEMLNASQAI